MIKFCPMCGQKIISGSKFCNGCGLNLVEYQRKLDKLAETTSTEENKHAQQEQAPAVAPVKADDKATVQKQSATSYESKAVVPQKNKPPQLVATVEDDLSAEELFERGFFAKQSELYTEAVKYFIRAIRLGSTKAMFEFGLMYDDGLGVKQDKKKAFEWYLKAANSGDDRSMIVVGRIYDDYNSEAKNYGVSPDEEKAKDFLAQAARSGNLFGMAVSGQFHCDRDNYVQSYAVWQEALKLGLPSLLQAVGDIYEIMGQEDPNYYAKSVQLYQRIKESEKRRENIGYLLNQSDAKDRAFSKEKDEFVFRVGEYALRFGMAIEEIIDIMKTMLPKINETLVKFGKFYERQENIDNVVARAYDYGISLLQELAGEGIRLMSKKGVVSRALASELVYRHPALRTDVPAEIWKSGTDKVTRAYKGIVYAAQSERDRRETRKENRARWHGYGYNISSAINAELKAGMMNMAEGAAHDLWNFFGNMSTDSAEASNKQDLYKSANTLMNYCVHLSEAMRLVNNRIFILMGHKDYLGQIEESQRIVKNVQEGYIDEDNIQTSLLNALLLHPFNLEAYALYLTNYGDAYCGLQHMATFLGLSNEFEALKKNIFVERMKKSGHQFKLFPKDSFSTFPMYINTEKLPSYEELKEDYEIIEKAAINLNLNIYGKDAISCIACCYRLFIEAYENEQNADKDDPKRIPAFKYMNQDKMGDVVIPEGIETIGAFAFAKTPMNSIKLPSTLKKIETGAFFETFCNEKIIDIPEGTEEIAINMAWGQYSPSKFIQLPSSIKRITGEPEGFAFKIFQNTETHMKTFFCFEPYLADMVRNYFEENNLMQHTNIVISEKFKVNGSGVEEIHIKDAVLIPCVLSDEKIYGKKSDSKPFKMCLSGNYYKHAEKSFVGFRAFANSLVNEVVFEDPVKIIRDDAFLNCRNLENLRLPYGLEKIGSRAFRECKNLKSVFIPGTVKDIGDDILKNCPAVIYCDANSFVADYCRKNNLPMEDYGDAKLQEGKEILKTARTEEDFYRARHCFEEASYIGNIEGSYEAGKSFMTGKEFPFAIKYFKRAAELGHKESMVELYKIYKNPPKAKYENQEVEQNVEEAAKWLALSGYDAATLETSTKITKVTNYGELVQFKENLCDEFNGVSCLYFPDKNEKSSEKLRKAQASYAKDSKAENVICVFDNTLFGGADDGFRVTDKKIYGHNAYENGIIVVPLEDVKSFEIFKTALLINGTIAIEVGYGGKSAAKNLPVMLKRIRQALVGDKS